MGEGGLRKDERLFRAVVFDLDGTLVDSLLGITEALNRCLEALGEPALSPATVRTYIGDGSWMLIKKALPTLRDEEISQQERAFQSYYAETWPAGTIPYAGSHELLDRLSSAGYILGVFSNKADHYTREIVSALFGDHPFACIRGHREGTAKKPSPEASGALCQALAVEASDVLYVGDSTVDLEFAQNAGFQGVGVTWGYHETIALERYKRPLFEHYDELSSYLGLQPGEA